MKKQEGMGFLSQFERYYISAQCEADVLTDCEFVLSGSAQS